MTHPDEPTFAVLVVCTANRFRSPAGEILLHRAATTAGLPWAVGSAGTHARPGEPMDPRTAEVLGSQAPPGASWRSRRLDAPMVARADLVLVAAEEHRRSVVTLDPAALHRTFPLRQFVRLVEAAARDGAPLGDGRLLLEGARRARARVQPASPGTDDVPDPVGKPLRVLRGCVELIDDAMRRIVQVAAG